jgi:hypothetical protein
LAKQHSKQGNLSFFEFCNCFGLFLWFKKPPVSLNEVNQTFILSFSTGVVFFFKNKFYATNFFGAAKA